MVIIQFRYLYLLSIRQNNFTTSLRRRYPASLWSCHIVAKETSDDVSIATILRRQSEVGWWRRKNVITTSLCLLGNTGTFGANICGFLSECIDTSQFSFILKQADMKPALKNTDVNTIYCNNNHVDYVIALLNEL